MSLHKSEERQVYTSFWLSGPLLPADDATWAPYAVADEASTEYAVLPAGSHIGKLQQTEPGPAKGFPSSKQRPRLVPLLPLTAQAQEGQLQEVH